MKLYATITSERASQGKALGGQEWLHIDVKDESEDVIGEIHITYNGEKTILDVVYNPYVMSVETTEKEEKRYCTFCGYVEAQAGTNCKKCGKELIYRIKGEKQKGEENHGHKHTKDGVCIWDL